MNIDNELLYKNSGQYFDYYGLDTSKGCYEIIVTRQTKAIFFSIDGLEVHAPNKVHAQMAKRFNLDIPKGTKLIVEIAGEVFTYIFKTNKISAAIKALSDSVTEEFIILGGRTL